MGVVGQSLWIHSSPVPDGPGMTLLSHSYFCRIVEHVERHYSACMVIHVVVSVDTVARIVLCDIAKVFAHPFTKVLLVANVAGNAVYNVIGFAEKS